MVELIISVVTGFLDEHKVEITPDSQISALQIFQESIVLVVSQSRHPNFRTFALANTNYPAVQPRGGAFQQLQRQDQSHTAGDQRRGPGEQFK
jgi:hypothetical protein